MRIFLRLLLFFLISLLCFTQNTSGQDIIKITGSVLDASTQDPIAGAKIKVKGTTKEITSNDQGLFIIYVPVSYRNSFIEVSNSGYKETYFSIYEYSGKEIRIHLEKNVLSPELIVFKKHLNAKLLELSPTHHERIFLHTDRNRYISGDNIYFKAYVTERQKGTPSLLSKSFHVLLIDSIGDIIVKVRFPLEYGIGNGNLKIPETINQGRYKLIAYSSFMQNFNLEDCYNQSIEVVNKVSFIESNDATEKAEHVSFASQHEVNVDFLPEGGNLVAGIQNNVGFCALTDKGEPIKLSLLLSNDCNNNLDTINTNLAGLGSFKITPHRNQNYYARIIDTISFGTKVFSLPEAQNDGIGLIVSRKASNNLSLKLSSTSVQPEHLRILLFKNSEILLFEEVQFDSVLEHDLTLDNTTTGTATLTILRGEEPIAERLVFLDSKHRLEVTDDLEYGAYAAREKMRIIVRVTDQLGNPVKAFLSASIVDSINCISNKLTLKDIRYTFWLHSNLKMNIPISIPMSILNKIGRNDSDLLHDIDLLHLTYGWRRYKSVDDDSSLVNYDHIQGKILPINKKGKNITVPELIIYEPKTGYVETIYPDNSGRFEFIPEAELFNKKLILNFQNIKMGRKWKIILDNYENSSYLEKVGSLKTYDYAANSFETKNEPSKLFDRRMLDNIIHIPEVTVKKSAIDIKGESIRLANSFRNVGISKSGASKEIKYSHDLESIINRILPSAKILQSHPTTGSPVFWIYFRNLYSWGLRSSVPKALFVINDVPTNPVSDGLDVQYMNPEMIDEITIIPGPQAFSFFGEAALGGVVMIYTKDPAEEYIEDKSDPGLYILPPLCNTVREFYKPNYNAKDIDLDKADYRLTSHWEPEIVTDNNGEAIIEYYNVGYNSYATGIIQGMSVTGEPICHRIRYIVVTE